MAWVPPGSACWLHVKAAPGLFVVVEVVVEGFVVGGEVEEAVDFTSVTGVVASVVELTAGREVLLGDGSDGDGAWSGVVPGVMP